MENKVKDFSFDFINKIMSSNNKNLISLIKDEFIIDCKKMEEIYKGEIDVEYMIELMLCYFSKYSLIIYFLERDERYEDCVEISNMFKTFIAVYYNIEPKETKNLINESIEFYKALIKFN